PRGQRVLSQAPAELTRERLERLGEGIGKVVYASEHWVVKRGRSPTEIIALVVLWRLLRRVERILPGRLGKRLFQGRSRKIRFLRVLTQGIVLVVPKNFWYMTHIGQVWRLYRSRDRRGERLAKTHLTGTLLVPERVSFPPARIRIAGWPGWLTVCEATERVEATLDQRLSDLAAAGRFEEIEQWLERFLDLRQSGWQHGLFSVDTHLKNFGVTGERVVLIDSGGLTKNWTEIDNRLSFDEGMEEPHVHLGLGPLLEPRPDLAERFDARWKAIVNREHVRHHWPHDSETEPRPQGSV
ncbi:MAG: hypothetical protein ACRD7E_14955, partial [Bryobacteraceae bacterium]